MMHKVTGTNKTYYRRKDNASDNLHFVQQEDSTFGSDSFMDGLETLP